MVQVRQTLWRYRLQQHGVKRLQQAISVLVWCGALVAGLQLATVVAADLNSGSAEKPVATLQEIMLELIDPNIDPLWNAVSTEVTANGVIETAPKTNAEWSQLKRHALTLAEIANLLHLPNRPVANGNTSSHVTELQPEAISRLIKAQRPAFDGHAVALQQATLQLLQAIEKRDLAAYEQAGANIEHSCEGCHSQFWYPADKLPPAH